jgi:hypothetical protein
VDALQGHVYHSIADAQGRKGLKHKHQCLIERPLLQKLRCSQRWLPAGFRMLSGLPQQLPTASGKRQALPGHVAGFIKAQAGLHSRLCSGQCATWHSRLHQGAGQVWQAHNAVSRHAGSPPYGMHASIGHRASHAGTTDRCIAS